MSERNFQTELKKDSHICEIYESFSLDAFGEILSKTLLATYPGRTICLLDLIGCPSDSNTRAPLMDPQPGFCRLIRSDELHNKNSSNVIVGVFITVVNV